MCFAPQRRALFRHRNFQKWSAPLVFFPFWLGNVLRATTACTFSTSQLLKVLRSWGVLHILTWTCALRHNGVQFFISHLASWLRTRRFSEPTFRPSGATNHWKNTVNRDFPTFSRICIFFLLTLSLLLFSLLIFLFSLPLPCSAFHLSILSEVRLLNFLRWCPMHPLVFMSLETLDWFCGVLWLLVCGDCLDLLHRKRLLCFHGGIPRLGQLFYRYVPSCPESFGCGYNGILEIVRTPSVVASSWRLLHLNASIGLW